MGAVVTKTILEPLSTALGDDLKVIADFDAGKSDRRKAKNSILRKVEKALEAVELKSGNKAHGSASTGKALIADGLIRDMPISWITLHVARNLVAERQSLPCKAELELIVSEQVPEAALLAESTWAKIWREAGLTGLKESKNGKRGRKKKRSFYEPRLKPL